MDAITLREKVEKELDEARNQVFGLERLLQYLDTDEAEETLEALLPYLEGQRERPTSETRTTTREKRPCPWCGKMFANIRPHASKVHPVEWQADKEKAA